MPIEFDRTHWALILGGSSGFGLATAQKLARHGMNIAVVHRDRKGAMAGIEAGFDTIRQTGVAFRAFNVDGLAKDARAEVLDALTREARPEGHVRLMLHSIALGNLKPLVVTPSADSADDPAAPTVRGDAGRTRPLDEEDFAQTVHAMGTSLADWTQDVFARGLFASSARVLVLTSEGNTVAWPRYAAVSAAKGALEAIARSIAAEIGPYGVRCNILQPGVTDTPALRLIPGSAAMKASALSRNPLGRLTTPSDIANVICLLCTDEADWVNGAMIRVDGGEFLRR